MTNNRMLELSRNGTQNPVKRLQIFST